MKATRVLAAFTAITLSASLAACSTKQPDTPAEYISVYGSEPQNPLVPTNTNENGGGTLMETLFDGLVDYDPEGKPYNQVAESITPNADSTKFTVVIKDGWQFHNGEEVTSDSFIDAWNYGADVKNAQLGSDFFSNIKGFNELSGDKRTADKLSGLTKIDDHKFTVELSAPEATWPLRLGYYAYAPLPKVAFKDMDAFGEHPIGNGPYMMDGDNAWTHNVNVRLKAFDNYSGKDKAQNAGLNFVFYTSLDTAYADLQAGDLDSVRETVGPNAYPSYQADFPQSHSNRAMASIESFGIPFNLKHFGNDEEGKLRRHALSMAINRDLITEKLFFGARTPAEDFGSPTLGGTPDIKGKEVLTYQPEKARELWAKADKIRPFTGKFQIAYNADGGHQSWVEAVTNSIRQTLGIPAEGRAYPNFKGLRDDVVNRNVGAGYRTSWLGDYPSIANFLESQYRTKGSSNDTDYSSAEFDALLAKAASSPSAQKAQPIYNQAQAVLMEDLPQIPLWYKSASTAWNPNLKHFQTGWNGYPEFTKLTKEGDN